LFPAECEKATTERSRVVEVEPSSKNGALSRSGVRTPRCELTDFEIPSVVEGLVDPVTEDGWPLASAVATAMCGGVSSRNVDESSATSRSSIAHS
jgi:hypothetical protein